MLFSRVTEAECRGSGHASVLPPALRLPRPCSQPRLSLNRGDWAAGGDRSPARLLAALAALHHGARMLPRGSCRLCYSQRKRGNLGTKAAELRRSLALFGDTSSGTRPRGWSRGGGEDPTPSTLAVPFLKAHGAAGLVHGRCWGQGDRSRGLMEQTLFWQRRVPGRAETRRGGHEPGRGERFAPGSFPSWLQRERGRVMGTPGTVGSLGVKMGPQKQPGWA